MVRAEAADSVSLTLSASRHGSNRRELLISIKYKGICTCQMRLQHHNGPSLSSLYQKVTDFPSQKISNPINIHLAI